MSILALLNAVATVFRGKAGLGVAVAGGGYLTYEIAQGIIKACNEGGTNLVPIVVLAASLGAALMWKAK